MIRRPRLFAAGLLYHVIARGNQRQPTFLADLDYDAYLCRLATYQKRYGVTLYAYCLMPNHAHLQRIRQAALPAGLLPRKPLDIALRELARQFPLDASALRSPDRSESVTFARATLSFVLVRRPWIPRGRRRCRARPGCRHHQRHCVAPGEAPRVE